MAATPSPASWAARVGKAWRRITSTVSGLLFSALFGVFIVQITARFGFNKPLPWTDEAAVILYLWVILWTAAWVVPERVRHEDYERQPVPQSMIVPDVY